MADVVARELTVEDLDDIKALSRSRNARRSPSLSCWLFQEYFQLKEDEIFAEVGTLTRSS